MPEQLTQLLCIHLSLGTLGIPGTYSMLEAMRHSFTVLCIVGSNSLLQLNAVKRVLLANLCVLLVVVQSILDDTDFGIIK